MLISLLPAAKFRFVRCTYIMRLLNRFVLLLKVHFEILEDSKSFEEAAKKVPILEEQLNRANNELILHGELQMKYQQRLTELERKHCEPAIELERKNLTVEKKKVNSIDIRDGYMADIS